MSGRHTHHSLCRPVIPYPSGYPGIRAQGNLSPPLS